MHRTGVHRLRMCGAEEKRAKIGGVQPVRQLAPQYPALGNRALAGDDRDAAQSVPMRRDDEAAQRVMRLLRAPPVQIERALGPRASALEVAPSPRVHPTRRGADVEFRRRA